MAGSQLQGLFQEAMNRKAVRNTVIGTIFLGLLYLLYPAAHAPSASVEIMRSFVSTDPITGPLRILPLGDSVTEGYGSTGSNSYRLALLHALTIRGVEIKYVGSLHTGSMENNENDGFWGRTIVEVGEASKPTWDQKPNVVLLHVGTNDMNNAPPAEPYDRASDRLGTLIDDLNDAIPDVTILVAQIIQSQFEGTSQRIGAFNMAIPEVVADRVNRGVKVLAVDMSKIGADPSTSDDKLHPNDAGYQLMSVVWLKGLQKASKLGWLTKPVEMS